MELNHDCVRQVLLDLENNLGLPNNPHDFKDVIFPKTFDTYGKDNVEYTLLKLRDANYIDAKPHYANDLLLSFYISSITWEGHQFLDTIRDSKIWKKTKNILSHLESASITFASNVASSVLSDFISGKIKL